MVFQRGSMTNIFQRLAIGGALAAVAACSSIIEGTTQTISFNSSPPGANCILTRDGLAIGNVKTPGGLVVKKTKHDIQALCSKEGFEDSTVLIRSDVAAASFGNILLGGGVGLLFDSATGADNKYDEVVNVSLRKKAGN
jgi:hypothetical protein